MTSTVFPLGCTRQWFTEIPCGRLLTVAVSIRQGVPLGTLVFLPSLPGMVKAELPGTQTGWLTMPTKTLPNSPSLLMVKLWAFFRKLLLSISIQGDTVRLKSTWFAMMINTKLGKQQWAYPCWTVKIFQTQDTIIFHKHLIGQLYQIPANYARQFSFMACLQKFIGFLGDQNPTFGKTMPRKSKSNSTYMEMESFPLLAADSWNSSCAFTFPHQLVQYGAGSLAQKLWCIKVTWVPESSRDGILFLPHPMFILEYVAMAFCITSILTWAETCWLDIFPTKPTIPLFFFM